MASKKTSASPTTKSGSGPRGPRSGSKSAFILSHSSETPARDVVEAGRSAGHLFSPEYVHSVRTSAKRAAQPAAPGIASKAERALQKLASKGVAEPSPGAASAPVKRGPGRPPKELTVAPAPAKRGPERPKAETKAAAGDWASSGRISGGDESELASLIVKLGLTRSEQVFERVKSALEKLSF